MPSATNTQKLIPIDNIRNDVVVLKGGQLRGILQVSSMNLALKSRDEQSAVIFEYQNFLNSLDFSVQILVNSRLMNVDEYIQKLQDMVDKQKSELLKMQTLEYIKFIQEFVEEANIVTTDFYVVIPFSLIEADTQKGGAGERAKSLVGKSGDLGTMDSEKFLFYKGQLMQRVDFVSAGLHRMGLSARMLTTEELISLFWSAYNAGDLRKRGLIKPMFG
ncbi:MAG: hypothetical protein WDZ39_00685 [Candidatus Spechtbacterales bacterium]